MATDPGGKGARVQWRRRARVLRWPAGMAVASWRYLRSSRVTPRGGLRTEAVSDTDRMPRHSGDRVQEAGHGVGAAYQRRYRSEASPTSADGAGDRWVLLGAASKDRRVIAADTATLARAVDERPLLPELLVTTEFGRWERFGDLRLAGHPRLDQDEPVRCDPTRHPVPGLRPAGLLQQVRGPAYAAAQRNVGSHAVSSEPRAAR